MLANVRRLLQRSRAFSDPVRNPDCAEFEVDLFELSRFVAERCLPTIGIHPYPLNEQLLAASAACRLRPGIVFDWGTNRGSSARLMWECGKAFHLGYEVHTIDLPPDVTHIEHPGDNFGTLVRGLPGVHLHRGDGVTVSLELWQKAGCPARPLFFVDGDHAYDSVTRELRQIFSASADASALVHDTFFQSPDSGYNVGPACAVQDVVAAHLNRFSVIATTTGLPGLTLVASVNAFHAIK
jgi:hypothetical protein